MEKLTFLFPLFLFFSCSQYYKFDALYDKGEYFKAYQILDNIKNKDSVHYRIRKYRIILKLSFEGDKDFLEKLKNFITEDVGKELKGYNFLGRGFISYIGAKSKADYSNTLDLLEKVKPVPKEFENYFYLIRGISKYKIKDYTGAIADLSKAYSIEKSPDTLYFIGMSYFNQGRLQEARLYFEKIFNITLDNFFLSLAYFQIGEIYYEQQDYQKAIQYYSKAIENYSEIPEYSFKLAKSLQRLGYSEMALKYLKTALRVDRNYATAWFYLNIN